jgi:AcrR family transcriptional regulator
MGPVITRSEILEVAARVIGKYGFDGASLRRIASEAGISYGTLQYHFRTKDLIWKAVVDEVVVPGWTKTIEGKPGQLSFLVKEFVGNRLEAAILRPGLSGAVLTDSTPEGEERLRYVAEATSAMREKVRQALLGLQYRGALRSVDVDAVRVVASIGLGCLSSAKTAIRQLIGVDLDDESQRRALVEGITDLLLYGMLPR